VQYNAAADTWTQKASVPGGWRNNAAAFSMNNVGYVCSGYSQYYAGNDLWEYFPGFDAWTQAANLPTIGRSEATGFTWGQYGAIAGGNTFGPNPVVFNDF
jgi:N-acetylneuraminic acid mutarotase